MHSDAQPGHQPEIALSLGTTSGERVAHTSSLVLVVLLWKKKLVLRFRNFGLFVVDNLHLGVLESIHLRVILVEGKTTLRKSLLLFRHLVVRVDKNNPVVLADEREGGLVTCN